MPCRKKSPSPALYAQAVLKESMHLLASRAGRWLLQVQPLQGTSPPLLSSAESAQVDEHLLQGGLRWRNLNVTWRVVEALADHHLACEDCSRPSKGTAENQRRLQVGPAPGPAVRGFPLGWLGAGGTGRLPGLRGVSNPMSSHGYQCRTDREVVMLRDFCGSRAVHRFRGLA